MEKPEEFIESSEYFSWEQYFTGLLVSETKDTYLHYNKSHLNSIYLNPKEKEAIIRVMEVIRGVV